MIRELYEETGTTNCEIETVCDYSVTAGEVTTYGRLFFAKVNGIGPLPESEISEVRFFKEMPACQSISYGRTYFTDAPKKIATLPIGYADGWTRLMAGKALVLVRGKLAPLVGRVCMDQCMIDVTEIAEVRVGDQVLLFGGSELPVEEVAAHMGTINYEVVCMVGKRVPRIYGK
jgi:alanine racemase